MEFTADWCGPCRQLAPVLVDLARQEEGRLKIAVIDVDQNQSTALRYQVLAAPTMILFHRGEPLKSMVGARSKRRLLADLEDVLAPVEKEGAAR